MSLVLGALLAAAPFLAQAPDAGVRSITPADSAQTNKQARRAQSEFERRRLRLLPTVGSSGGRCDVRVGRFCYWQDDDDTPPPPEPRAVSELRAKFLDRLASLAARNPGDGWIAAQRVRYLVEAKRPSDALAAAHACRAAGSWCASLAALALAAGPDVRAADSAVTAALSLMTPEDRCAALDIEPLIDGNFRDRYHRASCTERDSLRERWLWLARSTYATEGNEIRVELFARHLLARLASESSSPYGPLAGKDLRDLVLRYGWSTAWGKTEPRIGLGETPNAVGYDADRTFALAPTDGDLADPANIGDAPRRRDDPTARARFPIRGARTLGGLTQRAALFRRGDSTLAIAAFDASSDTAMRGVDSARAALVLLRDETTPPVVANAVHAPHGVLMATAPWRPVLLALELRDSTSGRIARARVGVPPADTASGRVALSDLLLFAGDSTSTSAVASALDSVLARAIVDGRIAAGGKLGLFWEMYGLADEERVTATIGLVPDESGFLRRIAERAGVATPRAPVHLRWNDAPEVRGSVGGRMLVIDLADVPEGRYTVEVKLDVSGQPTRRAASRVEIVSK